MTVMKTIGRSFRDNTIFIILCMIPFLNIITCNPIGWIVMFIINMIHLGNFLNNFINGNWVETKKKK